MVKPVTEAEMAIAGGTVAFAPHPDGKPWQKCCSADSDNDLTCQCFMKKPKSAPSRFKEYMSWGSFIITSLLAENGRFFCAHRKTDDGFHRECAGWAAKITKNR